MEKTKTSYLTNLFLGLSLAGTLLCGIGVFEGWWLQQSNAIGMFFILVVVVLVLAVFFIANLIFSIVNIEQHAPRLAYLYLWGPILIALAVLLNSNDMKVAKRRLTNKVIRILMSCTFNIKLIF